MGVQGDGVRRHQPYEFSRRVDDFGSRPYGFQEKNEAHSRSLEVILGLVDQAGLGRGEFQISDEEPDDCGQGEKNRGDDEGVVVAQTGDQSQAGSKGTSGAGHFIEDVHEGVHAS